MGNPIVDQILADVKQRVRGGMSVDDAVRESVRVYKFQTQSKQKADALRQAGAAPGEIGDFVDPTIGENLKAAGIGAAVRTGDLFAQAFTQPVDATIDTLTAGPLRRFVSGVANHQAPDQNIPMPLSGAVSGVGTRIIDAATHSDAANIRPNAVTDVWQAGGELAPAVVATAMGVRGNLKGRAPKAIEEPKVEVLPPEKPTGPLLLEEAKGPRQFVVDETGAAVEEGIRPPQQQPAGPVRDEVNLGPVRKPGTVEAPPPEAPRAPVVTPSDFSARVKTAADLGKVLMKEGRVRTSDVIAEYGDVAGQQAIRDLVSAGVVDEKALGGGFVMPKIQIGPAEAGYRAGEVVTRDVNAARNMGGGRLLRTNFDDMVPSNPAERPPLARPVTPEPVRPAAQPEPVAAQAPPPAAPPQRPTSKLPSWITDYQGKWFSPEINKARGYGANVTYVDVPPHIAKVSDLADMGRASEAILPDEWVARATPLTDMTPPPQNGFVRMYRGDRRAVETPQAPPPTEPPRTYSPEEMRRRMWLGKEGDTIPTAAMDMTKPVIGPDAPFSTRLAQQMVRDIPDAIRNSGPAGDFAARTMYEADMRHRQLAHPAHERINSTLGKLTPRQLETVQDMARGTLAKEGQSPILVALADEWKGMAKRFSNLAKDAGVEIELPDGSKVPWREVENYWPEWKTFENAPPNEPRNLYAGKSGVNNPSTKARTQSGDIPFDRRIDVLHKYVDLITKQIAEREVMGPSTNAWVDRVVNTAKQTGEDAELIRDGLKIALGGYPKAGKLEQQLAGTASNATVAMSMPFSFIKQPTQSILSAVRMGGTGNMAKTLVKLASEAGRKELRQQLVEAGAHTDLAGSFIEDAGAGLQRAARLTTSPTNALDEVNRAIAVDMGRRHTQMLADYVATGKPPTWLRSASKGSIDLAHKELETILQHRVSVKELKANGGKLSADDINRGAFYLSEQTQFPIGKQHIPPFWAKSPLRRTAFLFQRFAIKATAFAADEAIKPLARGKVAPLATLAIGAKLMNVPIDAVMDAINNRDPKDKTWFEKWVMPINQIGVAATVANIYYNAIYGNMPIAAADKAWKLAKGVALDTRDKAALGMDVINEGSLQPLQDYATDEGVFAASPIGKNTRAALVNIYPPAKAAKKWLE